MDKVFLNVLHEEEKLEDVSMDVLKGGQGSGLCDAGSIFDCKFKM